MSMDIQAHRLRDAENINLGSCIVAISSCSQYFAVGCLDQSLRVWENKFDPFHKQPYLYNNDQISGISDVCFMKNLTHIATTSLDSVLKILDLLQVEEYTSIQVPLMSAGKIIFAGDSLITCGDLGKISCYDLFSREVIKKMTAGDTCLSAVTISENQKKLAVGNINGDVYLLNVVDKEQLIQFKPHFKTIRSLTFDSKTQKIVTASDDTTIGLTDIETNKKQQSFEGHLEKVTSVKYNPTDNHIFYSSSFDKTIKIWDIRSKNSIYTHATGGSLWAMQVVGKHLIAGGESGVLQILNIQ